MERFNALGRGMQIMLVSSVLLLITTFFNWQEVEFDLGPLGEGSAGQSAWNGFFGFVMGLLTIVLIAWIVARLAAVDIPIPVSAAMTGAVLAFLIFACALIKNLTDDYSTFMSYVGVVLAALIAVGAWMQIQESGGVESLKSEIPSMQSSSTGAAAAPPPAPPPSAPEAAPPAAPEAAPSYEPSDAPADPAPGDTEPTDRDA
jgi:hypothetical protein